MVTVWLTPAARHDLITIWDYTQEHWGLDQAEKYTESIITTCTSLFDPVTVTKEADDIRVGYRKVLCGKYCIFFILDDDVIKVVRILYQSMDSDFHV